MKCTAYQKYHKRYLPVTHIRIDEDGCVLELSFEKSEYVHYDK